MAERRIYVFQHVACEDLGTFAEVLAARSFQPLYVRLFAGDSIPTDCDRSSALIFLGGPMSVNDEAQYDYLAQEKATIRHALERRQPVLGVCLGAQLLASAAGSRVFPGARPEIGWEPVSLTIEGQNDPVLSGLESSVEAVFHWHGETFDLPPEATRLAFSGLTMNQAFCVGANAYGLQFHLEVDAAMIAAWVREYRHDLGTDGAVQEQRLAGDTARHAAALRNAATGAMQRFLDIVPRPA